MPGVVEAQEIDDWPEVLTEEGLNGKQFNSDGGMSDSLTVPSKLFREVTMITDSVKVPFAGTVCGVVVPSEKSG